MGGGGHLNPLIVQLGNYLENGHPKTMYIFGSNTNITAVGE